MVKKKEGRVSNGEGSVRKRSDGTFEIRVSAEDALGRKKRISLYGKTRKEVIAKRDALKLEEAAGTLASANRHTMTTFLAAWLGHIENEVKPTTLQSYRYLVETHIVPRIGEVPLQKLTPLHVQGLINAMQQDNLSARTTSYARAVLRRALGMALRWGLVGRNVALNVEGPKKESREMSVWTPEQAAHFLDVVRTESAQYYPLFYLAITTGMRRGELLGLRWQDVDWQKQTLNIRQNVVVVNNRNVIVTPKTAKSRRALFISAEALKVLEQQQQRTIKLREQAAHWAEHDLVFPSSVGTPLGSYTLNRMWWRLQEVAELPRIRFHDLRHTYASLALAKKVALKVVSERLGHSNVAFTLQTYAHVYEEEHRAAALDAEQLFQSQEIEKKTPIPAKAAKNRKLG